MNNVYELVHKTTCQKGGFVYHAMAVKFIPQNSDEAKKLAGNCTACGTPTDYSLELCKSLLIKPVIIFYFLNT